MHAPRILSKCGNFIKYILQTYNFIRIFGGGGISLHTFILCAAIPSYIHERTQKVLFGGGGDSKKAPHKYKKGLPHTEKLAKNMLLKYSYVFASEKVLRKCNPKRTKLHNKQTFWGVCSNVPLNIVRSSTISLIFIKMNIFTIFFLQNCRKIHSRTHQIALF